MTLLEGAYLTISRSFCASYSLCQITPPWLDLLDVACTFLYSPRVSFYQQIFTDGLTSWWETLYHAG